METTEKFIIDSSLKHNYLAAIKKRSVIPLIIFITLFTVLLLFIIHASSRDRGPVIGISLFLFIFFGGTSIFAVARRGTLMEQLLKSEFRINTECIQGFNKFHFNKTFYFKDIYILKETRLGMYVVKGRYSYYDLHGRHGPLRFFDDRSIFIPTITKDYDRLTSLIREYKMPNVKYHSSV